MKESSSYKISKFPKDIIFQEIKESPLIKKVKLNDFIKMKSLAKEIDEFNKR